MSDEAEAEADDEEEAEEEAGDEVQDDSRPRFAHAYPRDPELDRLLTAFDAGNYALVRERAPKLIDNTEDEAVKQAALDLRRRIEPDPTSVYLLGIGIALLIFLYGYWLMHTH